MQALITKPGVQELLDAWLKAKETERTWAEYRLQVEQAILAQYSDEVEAIRAQLKQSTQL
jgi:hypothetical protein